MKKREESIYDKATGYYYYEDVPMTVNGVKEVIRVQKYRKPVLSAIKRILKKNKYYV